MTNIRVHWRKLVERISDFNIIKETDIRKKYLDSSISKMEPSLLESNIESF